MGILPICWIVNEHIGLICLVMWAVYTYSCRFNSKKVTGNAHNIHLIDLTEAFVVEIDPAELCVAFDPTIIGDEFVSAFITSWPFALS